MGRYVSIGEDGEQKRERERMKERGDGKETEKKEDMKITMRQRTGTDREGRNCER